MTSLTHFCPQFHKWKSRLQLKLQKTREKNGSKYLHSVSLTGRNYTSWPKKTHSPIYRYRCVDICLPGPTYSPVLYSIFETFPPESTSNRNSHPKFQDVQDICTRHISAELITLSSSILVSLNIAEVQSVFVKHKTNLDNIFLGLGVYVHAHQDGNQNQCRHYCAGYCNDDDLLLRAPISFRYWRLQGTTRTSSKSNCMDNYWKHLPNSGISNTKCA